MSMAESVATLTVPGYDAVACISRVEPGTGHTRYKIKGTRLRGFVVVIPTFEFDYVDPFTTQITMQFGDCVPDHDPSPDYRRNDALTVNNVELTGAPQMDITRVPLDGPDRVTPYSLGLGMVWRRAGGEAPDATRRRVAALFAAIIDHWRADPGNLTVRVTAARHAVRTGDCLSRKAAAMRETYGRISKLHEALEQHKVQYRRMELLRDGGDIDPPGQRPAR
jgi:hypothetical protein